MSSGDHENFSSFILPKDARETWHTGTKTKFEAEAGFYLEALQGINNPAFGAANPNETQFIREPRPQNPPALTAANATYYNAASIRLEKWNKIHSGSWKFIVKSASTHFAPVIQPYVVTRDGTLAYHALVEHFEQNNAVSNRKTIDQRLKVLALSSTADLETSILEVRNSIILAAHHYGQLNPPHNYDDTSQKNKFVDVICKDSICLGVLKRITDQDTLTFSQLFARISKDIKIDIELEKQSNPTVSQVKDSHASNEKVALKVSSKHILSIDPNNTTLEEIKAAQAFLSKAYRKIKPANYSQLSSKSSSSSSKSSKSKKQKRDKKKKRKHHHRNSSTSDSSSSSSESSESSESSDSSQSDTRSSKGKRRLSKEELAKVTCFKCQEKGHFADKCPSSDRKPRSANAAATDTSATAVAQHPSSLGQPFTANQTSGSFNIPGTSTMIQLPRGVVLN